MKILAKGELIERKLPMKMEARDSNLFCHELKIQLQDTKLFRIGLGLISENGTVLSSKFSKVNGSKIKLLRLIFNALATRRLKVTKSRQLLVVHQIWTEGYFHFLTEVLPKVFIFQRSGYDLKNFTLLLPTSYNTFHADLAQCFFDIKIEYLDSDVILARDFFFVTELAPAGNYNDLINKQLRTFFFSKLNCDAPVLPQEIVYVSRAKAKKRFIENESDLTKELIQLGIKIIHFEDYPIIHQIQRVINCKLLIGLHGAGLTNIFFMKANTHLLEIRMPDDRINNCYFSLASSLDINYWYVNSAEGSVPGSYTINPRTILDVIREILSDTW